MSKQGEPGNPKANTTKYFQRHWDVPNSSRSFSWQSPWIGSTGRAIQRSPWHKLDTVQRDRDVVGAWSANRQRSGAIRAPRGRPQRPHPMLAPPRCTTYSCRTAAPQHQRPHPPHTRWSRPTPVNKKHLWACSQFWSFSGESQKNILGTGELRAWQQYGNTIWQISMWRQSTRHMSLWFANAPRIKVFLLLFAPISWSHHCFLTPPLGTQTSTLPQTTAKPHSPWRLSGQTDPAQSAALWAVTEPSPASREQTHCGSPTGAPMSLSGHRHDNIRKMEAAQSVRDITHRAFAKRLWSETYANRKTSNRTFGSRLADQTRPQASKMLLVKTNWALDKGFHVKSVSFGSFKKSNCPSTPLIKIGFLSKTFQDLPSKMLQGNYTKTVSSTKDNIYIYVCVFY